MARISRCSLVQVVPARQFQGGLGPNNESFDNGGALRRRSFMTGGDGGDGFLMLQVVAEVAVTIVAVAVLCFRGTGQSGGGGGGSSFIDGSL